MRNGSLWSKVVFEKEVTFHELDFKTLKLDYEVPKSSIWKHTTPCDKVFFSSIIISQLRRPIKFKFSQGSYFMHMLRYTKWEDLSLHSPIVSHVFNFMKTHLKIKKNPMLAHHNDISNKWLIKLDGITCNNTLCMAVLKSALIDNKEQFNNSLTLCIFCSIYQVQFCLLCQLAEWPLTCTVQT